MSDNEIAMQKEIERKRRLKDSVIRLLDNEDFKFAIIEQFITNDAMNILITSNVKDENTQSELTARKILYNWIESVSSYTDEN